MHSQQNINILKLVSTPAGYWELKYPHNCSNISQYQILWNSVQWFLSCSMARTHGPSARHWHTLRRQASITLVR